MKKLVTFLFIFLSLTVFSQTSEKSPFSLKFEVGIAARFSPLLIPANPKYDFNLTIPLYDEKEIFAGNRLYYGLSFTHKASGFGLKYGNYLRYSTYYYPTIITTPISTSVVFANEYHPSEKTVLLDQKLDIFKDFIINDQSKFRLGAGYSWLCQGSDFSIWADINNDSTFTWSYWNFEHSGFNLNFEFVYQKVEAGLNFIYVPENAHNFRNLSSILITEIKISYHLFDLIK